MNDQPEKGDEQKAGDLGWRPGAKKSGNADGAKACTAINRGKANIRYTQR